VFVVDVAVQALVDSPTETRRVVNFKRLALTDLKVDIKRVPGKTELTKAFTEAGTGTC
jgi:large subunit ribosomal protein L14e